MDVPNTRVAQSIIFQYAQNLESGDKKVETVAPNKAFLYTFCVVPCISSWIGVYDNVFLSKSFLFGPLPFVFVSFFVPIRMRTSDRAIYA